MIRFLAAWIGCLSLAAAANAADTVRLHAAGSLRAAMAEIAKAYFEAYGTRVDSVFGGSGGLQERLAQGEGGDVFASADMGNPQLLTQAGKAGPTVLFAHNHLCAMLRPGLAATPATLLATLLKPSIKLATSTPKYDPAGDYAWAMFERAEQVRAGSRAILEGKALKIGAVPGSLALPTGVNNAMVWLFQEKRADIFVTYCTGGHAAQAELSGISVLQLPPELAVQADYGLTVLNAANKEVAGQFAMFILSTAGQKILAQYGFDAPLLPR